MQATRCLITAIPELTTGVEFGHNHFNTRFTGLLVYIDRDPSPIVADCNGAISMKCYVYLCAVAREHFIYGVINNLLKQVMKASESRITDIHSWATTYSLEALQHA